jgi:ectoine hydroxylase-related dioxygenase (phytanoyl-CoA dioxygenase family)
MLWDYRTFHSGTPNRSDQVRPMVYATYARRWYQDPVNFRKETLQRLVFEPDFLTDLPDDLRPLFAHARSAG